MKLHHIGILVKNIDTYSKQMIGNEFLKEVFDPIQKAKLALYHNYSEVHTELIQPLEESSFTWNFLKKNGEGFHHFCYESTFDEIEKIEKEKKLIKVLGPVPAVLFDGKNVLFYLDRNKLLVEFLIL